MSSLHCPPDMEDELKDEGNTGFMLMGCFK